jgi:hypothetical protein
MSRKAMQQRNADRQIYLAGIKACYEVIDMANKKLAEIDAEERAEREREQKTTTKEQQL